MRLGFHRAPSGRSGAARELSPRKLRKFLHVIQVLHEERPLVTKVVSHDVTSESSTILHPRSGEGLDLGLLSCREFWCRAR